MNDLENTVTAGSVIRGYFAEFWDAPALRTWEPQEWELKYYSTPKRLERERAKRNAEYRKDYDRAKAQYDAFAAKVERVCAAQSGLRAFLEASLERAVEGARTHVAAITARIEAFKREWNREVAYAYRPTNPADAPHDATVRPYEKRCEIMRRFWKHDARRYSVGIDKTWLDGHLEAAAGEWLKQAFDAFAPTDADKEAFIRATIKHELDRNELDRAYRPGAVFTDMVERFDEIIAAIERVLGGAPDRFDGDLASWGVGGHFNGIVGRGERRAKFTSFLAGGYNIQRLHIRYRVTELKS